VSLLEFRVDRQLNLLMLIFLVGFLMIIEIHMNWVEELFVFILNDLSFTALP
jgi:hypothetical protein